MAIPTPIVGAGISAATEGSGEKQTHVLQSEYFLREEECDNTVKVINVLLDATLSNTEESYCHDSATNSTTHEQESLPPSWADDDQCFLDSIQFDLEAKQANIVGYLGVCTSNEGSRGNLFGSNCVGARWDHSGRGRRNGGAARAIGRGRAAGLYTAGRRRKNNGFFNRSSVDANGAQRGPFLSTMTNSKYQ
ncbi:hypothetical protein TRVL_01458 [Trypanosoma vivax]|nr:hypothetical protein TRVL_01458 [Trypanosoma vivax]